MSVKGICENKCLKCVYTADETDGLLNDKAAKNHQSSTGEYGVGTSDRYGHVKLTTATSQPTGSTDGIARAGVMGYVLNQKIESQRIPVHGIFTSDGTFTGGAAIAELLGYGTWEMFYQIGDGQGTSVWFWRRTA